METILTTAAAILCALTLSLIVVANLQRTTIRELLEAARREERRRERVCERLLDRLTAALGREGPAESTTDFLAAEAAVRNGAALAPAQSQPAEPPFDIEKYLETAHRLGVSEEEVRAELVRRGVMPPERVG